ncbi:MAG: hypothetical protein U9R74_16875 [Pseudomonadota bacterium]|nr:hypothetical protein [Pseudomonadota bacterium]
MAPGLRGRFAPFVACLLAGWLASGCNRSEPVATSDKDAAPAGSTVIWFEDHEPGVSPYRTRMIVSEAYIRMDDGGDGDDFVLFDRRDRSIRSVSHENRSVFSIPYRAVVMNPPRTLDTGVRRETPESAPSIGGIEPQHVELTVNGEVCTNVVAAPGLLPEAARAMREFHESLAGEHAVNLGNTPEDMQSDCMLANLVFFPTRHLEYGFPVREWDYRGFARALQDFESGVQVDDALFMIPEDYREFSTGNGSETSS